MTQNRPHNIYIHVPFCMSKCNYCAFFSHACATPDWDKYTVDICDEIRYWGEKLGRISVPTIFFGGGTPSLMPIKYFERIMCQLGKHFDISKTVETTLESNPKTITREQVADFQRAGITRLSIGIQSFNDEKLRFLGRKHTAQDAYDLIDAANQCGLRVSGDFIYGLPNENVDDVIYTCQQINDIGLQHCSMYELTIEPDTPFGKMNLDMPTNETMAQMYVAIAENLKLPRYEVSNYATKGNECRHNQNVWDGQPYIGIGRGAAGRIYVDNTWYEQRGDNAEFTPLSTEARATEMIITGLRTIRGCRLTDTIKNVIDMDWVISNPDMVKIQNEHICATTTGMLVLDDLIVKLVK